MPGNTHVFLCGSPDMIDDMVTILGSQDFRENTQKEAGQVHAARYWQKKVKPAQA